MKQDASERRIKPIFVAAMQIADPHEQATYLDQACGDDAPLREQVERLLAGKKMMLKKIRADISMQARLQFWLYVHIPLAVALIAALLVHIVSVFLYW